MLLLMITQHKHSECNFNSLNFLWVVVAIFVIGMTPLSTSVQWFVPTNCFWGPGLISTHMTSWSWSSRSSTRSTLLVRSFQTVIVTPPSSPVLFLLIHSYPSNLGMSPCTLVSVVVIMWLLCVLASVFMLSISQLFHLHVIHNFNDQFLAKYPTNASMSLVANPRCHKLYVCKRWWLRLDYLNRQENLGTFAGRHARWRLLHQSSSVYRVCFIGINLTPSLNKQLHPL